MSINIDAEIQKALSHYAMLKINEMRTIVPVRTGRLRDSFRQSITINNVTIKNIAPYSLYVDQGTKYMTARNFTDTIFKDLEILEKQISEIVGKEIILTISGNIKEGLTPKI